MKRKDMQRGVLYAMNVGGFNTRPGEVLDPGQAPSKVRVKVYWTWTGQDDDYLNPDPPITDNFAKYDYKQATTGEILGLWSDYCARVKGERKAVLDAREAAEAEHKAEIDDLIERTQALRPLIGGFKGYIELSDLEWSFRSDRAHDSRFSAKHVLLLLEHVAAKVAADTQVSQ